MFCPKCKSLMMPKGKQFVCSCGYKQEIKHSSLVEKNAKKQEDFTVVDKEESINPIIDAECPKCHNMQAESWEVQTRSSDEPPTRFHKCTACKHTWREYK